MSSEYALLFGECAMLSPVNDQQWVGWRERTGHLHVLNVWWAQRRDRLRVRVYDDGVSI